MHVGDATASVASRLSLLLLGVLLSCGESPAGNGSSALSGAWVGTVTQPGGSWGDLFSYRLEIQHSGTTITGTSHSRWLVEPQHFADFRINGELRNDGTISVVEQEVISESRPPESDWCLKGMTLSYLPDEGGQLTGNWSTPNCLSGVVKLQRSGASNLTWPTAPQHAAAGFYGPCNDWPGHSAGCYWLSVGGWRDAQPFRRHYNDTFSGYHLGADWNLGSGNDDANLPVYAIADGAVSAVRVNEPEWGHIVFILHVLPIGEVTSMYAHVNWAAGGPPVIGKRVRRGEQIALIGNGQDRYPYHLHLEIRAGDRTAVGRGYASDQTGIPPQRQIDPNIFIRMHR